MAAKLSAGTGATGSRDREHAAFQRWLTEAKASKIPELCSLVAGIYRDYDAVRNALMLPWSQGQTEAQVHRLKLIKRHAYGRASFEQLRFVYCMDWG